ncbi:hypothetical protein QTP70_018757, partial [Hemibagrus guttatus]
MPNVAASSVMSLKEKTVGTATPRSPSNKDDDTDSSDDDDGPDTGSVIDPPGVNTTCLFTMTASKPSLSSSSASDLKDILDLLPNPKDNPIHFVKTLIQTTRNAQLCGDDYKFILMTKMGPMYDEDEVVAKDLVLPEGTVVLQYADDLLISAETADICKEATWSLLNRQAQQDGVAAVELVALTRACILSAEKDVTIYTDSRYAFGVAHDFGRIWQTRGFVSAE